jgi:plastocyanin
MTNRQKTITKKKLLVFLMALFLLVSAAVVIGIQVNSSPIKEVILFDKGFSPQQITIPQGTKVVWKIQGNNFHWPASDVHPLHNSYPDGGGCLGSKLDACRAMTKGESYSFVFEKEGTWNMHDHSNPELSMTVNVVEKEGYLQKLMKSIALERKDEKQSDSRLKGHLQFFSPRQKSVLEKMSSKMSDKDASVYARDICGDLSGGKFREKSHCYSETFYFIAKSTNQNHAFSTLSKLQKIDQGARNCHLIAHGIGWAMYENDPKNWREAIGKMSPECSYGGIHGIVEQFSASSGMALKADTLQTICDKNPTWACYHAIGHVLLVQTKNDLPSATDLCEAFSENGPRSNCLNGVFMEHMIGQNLAEHGILTQERRKSYYKHLDEFVALCSAQTEKTQIRSCWTEIIHASTAKFRGNVDEIYKVCEKAQTREAAMGCRRHALAEILSVKKFDPKSGQAICTREVAGDPAFERDCYSNLASITMSNAPEKVGEVIRYCSLLPKEYQGNCYGKIRLEILELKTRVPERAAIICNKVSQSYQWLCREKDK